MYLLCLRSCWNLGYVVRLSKLFLGQLKTQLERTPDTRVLTIVGPPATLTVEACLTYLEQILDVAGKHSFYSHELFERRRPWTCEAPGTL